MKILLADDHGLYRDSMSIWLKQVDDTINFDFAESYKSAEALLNSVKSYTLVMMDIGMPGMQGMLSIKYFCMLSGDTPLLVVSADDHPSAIQSARDAGAAGYVAKSSPGEIILEAVKCVIAGKSYFPKSIHSDSLIPSLEDFSNKEKQLLALLAEGKTNKDIAEALYLSEGTIRQYVSKILRQLGVDNRTQASIKAKELLRIDVA